jgi:hypothetical protein
MYGMKEHIPARNYFATIATPTGGAMWEHIRTNLGRKVAYAMLAKHYAGFDGYTIASFRDETQATHHDLAGLAQGSDGVLRK